MLFNSIEFAIYLPIVFILYWFITNNFLKFQNLLLLFASYVFYGWWDWRFLSLIIFSSFVDYTVGVCLSKTNEPKKRMLLLWTSILVNIGFLGFFKYYNFFTESFADAFTLFGSHFDPERLSIVLPVGISFYTFQTMSYSIDVYKRTLAPTKDIIAFFAFVSFFPQLVAGPIERATNLLPQFYKKRIFEYNKAVDGIRQMLWGLFKKVVIADNLSKYVEMIFDNTSELSTITLLFGLSLFSLQIYADFSGYSDIAIGTSRLFGFDLKINFRYPLFARSIGERWRNWHISLSTWFRDYIYIPMGGSRGTKWSKFRNVLILFTISGFWHGANWTFVFWGVSNGLLFAPSMLLNKNRKYLKPIDKNKLFPSLYEMFHIFITFWLIAFTYIFFRAKNIQHSKQYFYDMINNLHYNFLPLNIVRQYSVERHEIYQMIFFIFLMLGFEWFNRNRDHGLFFDEVHKYPLIRWAVYYSLTVIILLWAGNQENFIYFQF